MSRYHWFCLIFFSASATTASADLPRPRMTTYDGVAVDLDTGALRYRERHWLFYDTTRLIDRRVRYLCPDGQAFGEKRVDYAASAFAPTFALFDARTGHREGLRKRGSTLEVFSQVNRSEPEEAFPITRTELLVADAGFDEFLVDRWSTLANGDAVKFDFLVPSEGKAIGFKVKPVQEPNAPVVIARLSLGAWWGFLAPSLDAHYDRRTKRLLRYEGLSNLRDVDGENYSVRIDFREPPREITPAEAARQYAAPLVPRCPAEATAQP